MAAAALFQPILMGKPRQLLKDSLKDRRLGRGLINPVQCPLRSESYQMLRCREMTRWADSDHLHCGKMASFSVSGKARKRYHPDAMPIC
jgi:hypothetical protein